MEVSFWDRSSIYSDASLRNADVFLLVAPNNGFKFPFSSLPPGCQKELNQAISLKKSIYLIYTPTSSTVPEPKTYTLYVSSDKRVVEGLPGSTGSLPSRIEEFNRKQKELKAVETRDDLRTWMDMYGSLHNGIKIESFKDLNIDLASLYPKKSIDNISTKNPCGEVIANPKTEQFGMQAHKLGAMVGIPPKIKVEPVIDSEYDERLLLRRR